MKLKVGVALKGFEKEIYRVITFQEDILLKDFCEAIIYSMNGTISHVYNITYKNKIYTTDKSESEELLIDNICLKDLQLKKEDEMTLEYDLGDGWEFHIRIEEITKELQDYPVIVLSGSGKGIIEDCKEDYKLGDFSITKINQLLEKKYPQKRKPIIGIIGRIDETIDNSIGTLIPESYLRAIIDQGGSAIGIVTTEDYQSVNKEIIKQCDGIFFTGGKVAKDCHFEILNTAIEEKIPVLGICLGMQIIGMNSIKERVIASIENHDTKVINYEDNYIPKHKVFLKKGTRIYDIYNQEEMMVNSRHARQILKVNKPYIVSATSETGSIEAVELQDNDLFVVGVQWHPETYPNQEKLFQTFLKEAEKHLLKRKKS